MLKSNMLFPEEYMHVVRVYFCIVWLKCSFQSWDTFLPLSSFSRVSLSGSDNQLLKIWTRWSSCGSPSLSSFYFIFLRKISPELATANPPLFAEEDWPWANIHAHLPLLSMWDAHHSMAFAKRCHVRTWDLNGRTPGRREAECAHLTAVPLGRPPKSF